MISKAQNTKTVTVIKIEKGRFVYEYIKLNAKKFESEFVKLAQKLGATEKVQENIGMNNTVFGNLGYYFNKGEEFSLVPYPTA